MSHVVLFTYYTVLCCDM